MNSHAIRLYSTGAIELPPVSGETITVSDHRSWLDAWLDASKFLAPSISLPVFEHPITSCPQGTTFKIKPGLAAVFGGGHQAQVWWMGHLRQSR